MDRILLIDDVRSEPSASLTARSVEVGKEALLLGGWDCLWIDHDLGEETSGYDILVWAIEQKLLPEFVSLITANPVGRMNMKAALISAGYDSLDGINFARRK
jgi:hypothetical protein